MEFYRADKRIFQRGDTIETARHFEEMHPEAGKRLEVLLRERKPAAKPDRSNCLMLFREEQAARHYHSKMEGGRLYKVQADPANILHEGDMTLVNQLDAAITAGELPTEGTDRSVFTRCANTADCRMFRNCKEYRFQSLHVSLKDG